MVEMKKLSVFLRTGEPGLKGVFLEGDNLTVFSPRYQLDEGDGDAVYSRLLRVKDGEDIIAEFQNWDYWKKGKAE